MRDWSPEQLARAAGARLVAPAPAGEAAPDGVARSGASPREDAPGPVRTTIDSRDVGRGDLFVGLPGTRTDGGRYAGQALAQGAWGVLV